MRERKSRRFFIVYGHYDDSSFNAAIKNTFIESAEKAGHSVDIVDLYKDKFDPVGNKRKEFQQKKKEKYRK